MSVFDVGTAFVRVLPDTRQFRAALEAELAAITRSVQTTVAVRPVLEGAATAAGAATTGATAAATSTGELAASAGVAAGSVADLAAAQAAASGTATELTVSTTRLTAAELEAAGATEAQLRAAAAVERALLAQSAAEAELTAAIAANADATVIQTLRQKENIAALSLSAATQRELSLANASQGLTNLGVAGEKASKGLISANTESRVLQGSIVGLSRITPVAVFGLGVAGSAAIAAGLAFKSAVGSAAAFEQQLNTFQAVTGVSANELKRVRDEAIALGADTSLASVSAGDAATALTELAKAGISVRDSLAAARGVLELAGAAQISAGAAAQIVATQLNAFKLSGIEAVRVADLLASASIQAQGEITDFAAAFQQVAAVAHQSGLDIQTTTALLTELARAGLQGADAGTSLRTTLLRFIPTTKQAQQFVAALGVEFDKSKTLGEQLPQVIEQYRAALAALNPIQRTTVLNQIFGQDAIRAASIIFDQSTGALERNTRALETQGTAAQLSAAKAEGLKGAFAGLQSNLQTVGVEIGSLVDGPLEKLVRGLSDTITNTENLIVDIKNLGIAAASFPAVQIPIKFLVSIEGQLPGGGFLKDNTILPALGKGLFFGPQLLKLFAPPKPPPAPVDIVPENLFSNFTDAIKSGNQKAIKKAQADIKDAFTGANSDLGFQGFLNNFVKGQAKKIEAAKIDPGAAGAIRAAVQATIKLTQGSINKALSPGQQVVAISESGRFQTPLLEAQLTGNLQGELAADRAIENFLRARLELAKNGSAAFLVIQKALKSAHDASQAVLDKINSDQKKAQQDQAQALQTNLQNQQTRLEIAAQAAGAASNAQKQLVAFLEKESTDTRLTEQQRLAFLREFRQQQKTQQAAIVEAAKERIDLQNQLRDATRAAQLSAADLTPGTADNKRVFEAQIRDANEQIARDKVIAAKRGQSFKVQQDALIDIQNQIAKINNLKASIKGLTSQGQSFTLQDLFKEAEAQFSTFGSNIASRNGVLSPQDVRGDFGRTILQGRDASLGVQTATLTEAEKQTALLQSIDANLRGVGVSNPARAAALVSQAGNFGGWRAAREAANNLYAAN